MQEFRVVEVESEGLLDNYAARSLGEYVVERLQSMLLPDGKFKDKKLQAEFEVWLKTERRRYRESFSDNTDIKFSDIWLQCMLYRQGIGGQRRYAK